MSAIVEPGRVYFDNSIRGLSSGLAVAYFYAAGNSFALKPTYPTAADQAALTNANPNPRVLNSSGRLASQTHGAGTYRMVVKTLIGGTTILDEDNLVPLESFDDITQSFLGPIVNPRTPAEISSGVTPSFYAGPGGLYFEGDVRRYGARVDGATDDYASYNTAFTVATLSGSTGRGLKITSPAGISLISQTLMIPNATVWEGAGRQQSLIRPFGAFTGVMVTDKGNASKIFIKHLRIEALNTAGVTGIIKLGYGVTSPFAQAELYDLFIAGGVPGVSHLSGCTGIDTISNVGDFTEIEVSGCGTNFNEGPNSDVTTYTRCFDLDASAYGFKVNAARLVACESEAPQAACVSIYAATKLDINGWRCAQSNSATVNPYLIELAATVTSFTFRGIDTTSGGGASTLTHMVKDDRTGYPTYWMDSGQAEKEVQLAGDDLYIGNAIYRRDHKWQEFKWRLTNSSGLKHLISSLMDITVASTRVDRINATSVTLTTIATATDASTAFTTGAKISSAATNTVYFDALGIQAVASFQLKAKIQKNTTTVPLDIEEGAVSVNINGVTQIRPFIRFWKQSDGTAFDLTAGVTAGMILDVNLSGYLN